MVKKSKIRELAASVVKKRASNGLNLTLPLARARKLAGDLYEAAGLKIWAAAFDAADEAQKHELIRLQDAICDAGDFLRAAKANNPRHLRLFCIEDDSLRRFVTAADEAEALKIFREAQKNGAGDKRMARRPKITAVPTLGASPRLHDATDA